MNLPAPCSLRGSLGSGGARLGLSPASRGGLFQAGQFSFQPEGGTPATLPRFPEPPLPHPSAFPAGCRGPGMEEARSGLVPPARSVPGARLGPGEHPRQGRVVVLLPEEPWAARAGVCYWRPREESRLPAPSFPRPRERCRGCPGTRRPFPRLETAPHPEKGWDGMGRAGPAFCAGAEQTQLPPVAPTEGTRLSPSHPSPAPGRAPLGGGDTGNPAAPGLVSAPVSGTRTSTSHLCLFSRGGHPPPCCHNIPMATAAITPMPEQQWESI